MKKIIVAATMIGALLTTTMANAQNAVKNKKVSKTVMQTSNTSVAKEQMQKEDDTKTIENKMNERGTKTRTANKSKVVKTYTKSQAKELKKK